MIDSRARDPETGSRDPETGSKDPETGSRNQRQAPEPETGSRTRVRNQSQEPESGARSQSQEPGTGSRSQGQGAGAWSGMPWCTSPGMPWSTTLGTPTRPPCRYTVRTAAPLQSWSQKVSRGSIKRSQVIQNELDLRIWSLTGLRTDFRIVCVIRLLTA